MDAKKEVKKILKALGASLSIDNLQLDDNNHCILLFGDKIVLNIDLDEGKELLVVYTYIGEVPLEGREELFEKMLEANFFWQGTSGATIGIDKQSQTLILAYSVELPLRKPADFEENLASFVETVEKWMDYRNKLVEEYQQKALEDEDF